MSTSPAPSGAPPHSIPAASYDLSARLSEAKAVAFMIADAIPSYRFVPDEIRKQLDQVGALGNAVFDLLGLAQEDHENLERQLRERSQSC